jgi:CubicO group peptidase (beta-lactamase class C family)
MKKSLMILIYAVFLISCIGQSTKTIMSEMENILSGQVEGNNSPSIQYVLFDKDSILTRFSFGYSDIKNNKKVTGNTTYNAFSVTKTFTVLAILQLAQEKKIDIEQPINNYLPEFPYSSNITIRQLLTHSAGIPNPIPLSWIHLTSEHKSFDRNEFFKNIFTKHNKTKSGPNEKYAYSNLGYIILGQLIEKVSGITYEQYINANIIKRLGLTSDELGFEIQDINRHAKGYHKKMNFFNLIIGFFIDKSKYMEKAEGKFKPFRNFYVNGASYGGLIGTPEAFVKYIQALLKSKSQLLSDEYKKMLFTENFTSNNKATGMCLSWFSGQLDGNEYFAHAGGGGGYYCEIRIYPEMGIGSVIFFNRTGMSDERFLDKVDKLFIDNNGKPN